MHAANNGGLLYSFLRSNPTQPQALTKLVAVFANPTENYGSVTTLARKGVIRVFLGPVAGDKQWTRN
jgi:hypothetical protein